MVSTPQIEDGLVASTFGLCVSYPNTLALSYTFMYILIPKKMKGLNSSRFNWFDRISLYTLVMDGHSTYLNVYGEIG